MGLGPAHSGDEDVQVDPDWLGTSPSSLVLAGVRYVVGESSLAFSVVLTHRLVVARYC